MNDGEKTKRKSLKIFHGIKKQRNIIYFLKIISNSASGIYIFHYIGKTFPSSLWDRYFLRSLARKREIHARSRTIAIISRIHEFKVLPSTLRRRRPMAN